MDVERVIYSIGHSNLSLDQLLDLLQLYEIKAIADVRRFPTSKKYPHFQRSNLQTELEENSIKYLWLGELLGGYRKGGYQSYMKSESFLKGIEELIEMARSQKIAFLCAEKLFLRCHRRFISDYLFQSGWKIIHIFDENIIYPHKPSDTMQLDF